MINLEKYSGLPIQMRDDYSLVFENGLPPVTPTVREFSAMKSYLKDPSSTFWNKGVYYMYRNIAKPEDREAITNAGIQYDITVVLPGLMGDEFSKTIGHYHSFKPGTQVRYPEIYEVIYGRVVFIIQSATSDLEQLQEAYAIKMERGEKVLVPPGFGHVLVNPTDDVAVTANWQPSANVSDYTSYEKHNGAAYYVVQSKRLGSGGKTSTESKYEPNLNYKNLPKLAETRPRELPQYELRSAIPMYFTGVRDLAKLDLLVNPDSYLDDLTPAKLFV
ncbi:MAG: hypothetical protein A2751_05265 [Candidatus Doudnabacteria bacterium RIFCSPHIGHO2_01_FULL_46_14]|uniref:glucose-6-phosphate isomerase n=1 Tax=Candidatus Doudnabacteria bacterium RIFCSPHIGHO2_01_FULL_46_14 TaxID=1817824 RepID=A0A1F5NP09_9BACT|nr:MAG: hypothetical protein A2751_05265 [Candidatus Doudnabacteria bacterium RIFCSPHIGHO2_01_FULL_46_14]